MRSLWVGVVVGMAACGGPVEAGDAGGDRDAGADARVALCASATECQGADECTTYDCRPGDPAADARGCVVEPMCTAEQVCRSGACVRSCTPEEADGDGDGFDNPACGGADCNDAVNTINPGATEVCDPEGVDEDCNPNTIRGSDPREGDADNDALISSACWNPRPDGTENRGPDCDDTLPGSQLGTVGHCSACGDACQFRCDSGSCTGLGQVSVGNGHTCALDGAGTLYCWGDNQYGQLGDDSVVDALRPRRAALVTSGSMVAAGLGFTCMSSGTSVQCWGRNSAGQLGNATLVDSRVPVNARFPALLIVTVHQVAAGGDAAAAIVGSARELWCWGSSAQCGLAMSGNQTTPARVDVPALTNLAQVALGQSHGCVLRDDGQVYCFGSNFYGQLGFSPPSAGPFWASSPVMGIPPAAALALGRDHSCALGRDGTVWCWGRNDNGVLGDGATHQTCGSIFAGTASDCTGAPVQVVGLTDAIAIGPACALRRMGALQCWHDASTPVETPSTPATLVGSHGLPFMPGVLGRPARPSTVGASCVSLATGRLWCWGDNESGQAGRGTTDSPAAPGYVLPP